MAHPSKRRGYLLKARREALGMSQPTAATLAGIHVAVWCRYERGHFRNPSLRTALKMAKALGLTLYALCADWGIE